MIDSINFQDYNPYLGYKLDPGEPGLANSSPASLSILRVAAHEAGNINQFKSQAIKNGGVVIYSDIELKFEKRGGFLAAVAGKSKAVILYKKESEYSTSNPEKLAFNQQQDQEKSEKIKENIEKEIEKLRYQLLSETDPQKREELLIKLQDLEILKSNSSSLNIEFFLGLKVDLFA
ncbi:hypothetical protein [Petrotoga sp. 9PWA.NaAc.5.4]|uniref:hypothetical protein n=1 Tax=Petrotoga sp. 9PWA.NaAc.5.4 TaxID=1434328 RepID=UPI000EFAA1DF|nr:hypothetical protein [Petrotoga sp. 9PWA.NaAc.5.4]